jgi:two-component system cell cycle response regulator
VSDQITPKVLLVDDDRYVLEHLGRYLHDSGYPVVTAPDSGTALASMQQAFAPIVILDVNLPGMDGLTLCRTLRRQSYPGYTYLMLHSVSDAEEDIIAGFDAGADDYISKRASKSQLIRRLRTAQRIVSLEHSLTTALKKQEHEAMTDPLTGAYNRRYMLRQLNHELAGCHRSRGDLSVLLLDFDHFSHVNDRYGHSAGDEALKEFVKRIHGSLRRDCDWCARLGGDEFAGTGIVRMTVSIGVSGLGAIQGSDPITAEVLLDLADKSLYRSKKAGRNRVTVLDVVHVSEGQ